MAIEHLETNIALLKKNFYHELDKEFDETKTSLNDWTIKNFDKLFNAYISSLLKTEFELFIDNYDGVNYKNGYSTRVIKTVYGEITIKIPRDRNGEFNTKILTHYSSATEDISKIILNLFQLGLSHKDICNFLDNTYNVKYSRQSISNMTLVANETVLNFNNRSLDSYYIALFLDATYIPIKFDSNYERQALHLVVGISYQEIISYAIGFSETTILWADVLDDLKNRGLNTVDIFITDGFVGLAPIIKARFPTAKIQRCLVHILRNVITRVSKKDSDAVLADFKALFGHTDIHAYQLHLEQLLKKYSKYESSIRPLLSEQNILTYFDFPQTMHKSIKNTNRIEAVNQKIKTRIKFKQNFPNKESFERTLVASIIQQNNNSNKSIAGLNKYIT